MRGAQFLLAVAVILAGFYSFDSRFPISVCHFIFLSGSYLLHWFVLKEERADISYFLN